MVPRMLITRKKWNAGVPRYTEPLQLPVSQVNFYHCDLNCKTLEHGLDICKRMQFIDTYACQFPDLAFNFLVGDDGTIYEGRGWNVCNENIDPDETGLHRPRWLDVAMLTDYRGEQPGPELSQGLQDLVLKGIESGYITKDYKSKVVYMGF